MFNIIEKNNEFYNNHTVAHNIITVVYAVGSVVVLNKFIKKICNVPSNCTDRSTSSPPQGL